ncbi:hypothetical protein J5T34_03805 [Cupriavidus gilardii]|uniref:hypothetical protein n=1 Tax=Cupriavidus gilardii TaxID=82541 RepID=UPI001ABEA577|nr:hypothetical protein [Cupriavidus gilardii]MBO4119864.1 hypothetical protein [Cupriavidus gilardii]
MAEKEAHDDMPDQGHHTFILEARPEIQVFIAKNEKISIVVTQMRDERDSVDSDVVQIPLDCAEQVGMALINIAKKYTGL